MNIPLSTQLSSCERHSKTVNCSVTDDFSFLSLRLHCHKLVLFNLWPVLSTQLQVPQNSTRPVLLRIRQLSVSSLLHCNSWRQTHIVSVSLSMDMISPFPESYFFSVLGQVYGVCLLRQKDLPEVDGTSACSRCACVRACTITITAEADPVQVSS